MNKYQKKKNSIKEETFVLRTKAKLDSFGNSVTVLTHIPSHTVVVMFNHSSRNREI